MSRILLILAIGLMISGAQAGLMITQHNPVAIHFDHLTIDENGTMTVYITDDMMPEKEEGIVFVQIKDSHDGFCGDC